MMASLSIGMGGMRSRWTDWAIVQKTHPNGDRLPVFPESLLRSHLVHRSIGSLIGQLRVLTIELRVWFSTIGLIHHHNASTIRLMTDLG